MLNRLGNNKAGYNFEENASQIKSFDGIYSTCYVANLY